LFFGTQWRTIGFYGHSFANRVWYESHVFDLLTIIDKLGLHMVQSKCIVGLDSFCVFQRNLWWIYGTSLDIVHPQKWNTKCKKKKMSSNVTVSQIMTTITPNSWGGKQIVPKAIFKFHTIGNLMHYYHLHPYPLFGPLAMFIASEMVY
jgi:hypothetical protein